MKDKVTRQDRSEFAAAIDKIVADCNDRLLWVPYSKHKLTQQAARVLIEQWSRGFLSLASLADWRTWLIVWQSRAR